MLAGPKRRMSRTRWAEEPFAGILPAVYSAWLPGPEFVFQKHATPYVSQTATRKLALAELEALAGALLAVLLAFAHARIAGQETIFAQARAQLRVEYRERAGQSHAHRARLAANAATIHGGHHVHLILGAGE